jgi:hypothetical protein
MVRPMMPEGARMRDISTRASRGEETLRIENGRQKRKTAKKRTYIASGVFYHEQKGHLVRMLPRMRQQRGSRGSRGSD